MVAKIVEGSRSGNGDVIELLEEARGVLECLGMFGEPEVDLSGFRPEGQIKRMASAAEAAARLVVQAQALLIESKAIEKARAHG